MHSRDRLTRWLALAIAAATVLWLGYSAGRVQSISDLARMRRDVGTDRYTLGRGGVLIHFERLGGDGKPYIRSDDGIELLDLSDWDRASRVVVDGTLFELVRLYPQSAVDYDRLRLAETLNGDGWLLQREITLDANGDIQIEHFFVARRPIHRVDLAVAHTHTYFVDLQVQETDAVATMTRLKKDQIEAGVQAPAAYRVAVRALPETPGVRFRYGQSTAFGPSSFVADMATDDPPRDSRVVLGTELLHIDALPS